MGDNSIFNRTFFLYELKRSMKLLVVLGAVMTMYIVIIIDMYDSQMMKTLDSFSKMMPDLLNAVGMTSGTHTFKSSHDTISCFIARYNGIIKIESRLIVFSFFYCLNMLFLFMSFPRYKIFTRIWCRYYYFHVCLQMLANVGGKAEE